MGHMNSLVPTCSRNLNTNLCGPTAGAFQGWGLVFGGREFMAVGLFEQGLKVRGSNGVSERRVVGGLWLGGLMIGISIGGWQVKHGISAWFRIR